MLTLILAVLFLAVPAHINGDGNWSDWSDWSSCSVTCGNGDVTRTRTCTNPPPSNGSHNCTGPSSDSKICNNHTACTVHGGWDTWLSWEPCSVTCGAGIRRRRRECSNPAPSDNGRDCRGDTYHYDSCTTTACLVAQPNVTFYMRDVQNHVVDAGDRVLYNTTLWNTAGSYNLTTGVFTAPVTGVYVFTVTATVVYKYYLALQIKTSSWQQQLAELFHIHHTEDVTSSMTGVGALQAGSQVWVQCLLSSGTGDALYDRWTVGYQNSFQGTLVKTL